MSLHSTKYVNTDMENQSIWGLRVARRRCMCGVHNRNQVLPFSLPRLQTKKRKTLIGIEHLSSWDSGSFPDLGANSLGLEFTRSGTGPAHRPNSQPACTCPRSAERARRARQVRCLHSCARILVSAFGLSGSRVCWEGEDMGVIRSRVLSVDC